METKKQRTVTLLGEQVKVKFNLAVEIAFEKITGETFSVKALESLKNTIALYAAIIAANNPDINIGMNNLLHDAPFHEIQAMRDATIDAIVEACLTGEELKQYNEAKKIVDAEFREPAHD